MAGIGFELKKLFEKKGVFALLRAYGYAGVICAGPMLLGVLLLLGIFYISEWAGASRSSQDLLTAMITYTLLASLVVTNGFGMITTRFIADSIYEGKNEKVMPSFYGSVGIQLVVGGLAYLIFLLFAGIEFRYVVTCFLLFQELVVVWMQMNYLTAIKDYKGIMVAIAVSIGTSLLLGYILTNIFHFEVIITLLRCVTLAYGIIAIWYYYLLLSYFPQGEGSIWSFLRWLDKYPALFLTGEFISVGMFAHLVLMWASPVGIQIQGLFYMAPQYDIPAIIAFLSTLVTTVNFVTSVEVNFYPKYRNYYSLYNDHGSITDIEQAGVEMNTTLQDELSYNAVKQVFATILFVVIGSLLIEKNAWGFNDEMLGIFRVLCAGYAFYAIGNSIMLMCLYFSDEKGALISTSVFALVSVVATILIEVFSTMTFYGFGFVLGSASFFVVAVIRLMYYGKHIGYYVLNDESAYRPKKKGIFTRIADKMEQKGY